MPTRLASATVFGKLCVEGLGRDSRHKEMSFIAPFLGNSNITYYTIDHGCGLFHALVVRGFTGTH